MKNQVFEESQFLILHNDISIDYKKDTIEISSSTMPSCLCLQVIGEDEKLISSFELSERMAKQIISFMQNHYNL